MSGKELLKAVNMTIKSCGWHGIRIFSVDVWQV